MSIHAILPIDGEYLTSATNHYGLSKLHVEELLVNVAKTDATWRIARRQYFNLLGAHESGLIGQDHTRKYKYAQA